MTGKLQLSMSPTKDNLFLKKIDSLSDAGLLVIRNDSTMSTYQVVKAGAAAKTKAGSYVIAYPTGQSILIDGDVVEICSEEDILAVGEENVSMEAS